MESAGVEKTGSQTTVEGTDSEENVDLTQARYFNWEKAFARRNELLELQNKKKAKQGAGYTPPKAPTVTLSQITNTGRVTLTFSEDMNQISDD